MSFGIPYALLHLLHNQVKVCIFALGKCVREHLQIKIYTLAFRQMCAGALLIRKNTFAFSKCVWVHLRSKN